MDDDLIGALSGAAGLAGVQRLLLGAPAQAALRATVAGLLDGGAALDALTLQRAKYKPGRHLTAYYAAKLRGAPARPIEVSWTPPGSADRRGDMDALLAAQAEIVARGLAAPFRALLADDPAWGLRVQLYPLDAEYSKLARLADPAYVHDLLASGPAAHVEAAGYQITPIRYRPGQRHVLRYDPLDSGGRADERGTLFAKIYNSDKGARTFHVATRVADWLAAQGNGIGAARPQSYIAAEGLVLYPRVVGTPLSDLLRDRATAAKYLRAAGAAIRTLHTAPESLVELQPHSFAKELKGITSASEHVRPLLPHTADRIEELLQTARDLHQRLPQEPPSFAYGDFKADHLWVTPGGLTLIDFDTCYLSDPAIDLGKFLADIQWWHDVYALDGVAEAQDQFLGGYSPADAGRLQRARLYEALVLIKSTVRRVKLFDPDWAPRTERLVARAAAVLDRLT
jgi:hypothetical protein